ncbi:MAG: ParB/RepB/Spo0J family partition protein [Desulfovibrionaceae bacterium]
MAVRGLGRGLDALLGGSHPDDATERAEVRSIPLGRIEPNPHQPRREFNAEALEDLANSIRTQGVLQPILVRPLSGGRFELVAGERRTRAARLAGLDEIPALVRELDDRQSLAIALIENLQREDLSPIEEAEGYRRLMEEFGLSQEDLAKSVGKSRPAVANTLRLLGLSPEIQRDLAEGRITSGHARSLAALDDAAARDALNARIQAKGLTVRQAEAEAAHFKRHGVLPEDTAVVVATPAAPPEPAADPALPEPPAAPVQRAARARVLDQRLAELQDELGAALGLGVSITGHPSRGRLTLSYRSAEELERLARLLGSGRA